ncbi:MAG: hypothetical protein IJI85_10265 [Clostridia bacterium]|nr:hypothetical protein [Clostridia bacterium]
MQYKIENETLIPAPVNFRTPEGATICNFSSSPELMAAHGYTLTEEEAEAWRKAHPAPEPPPRTTCTKYELVAALREHFPELLAELRQAYATDAELQFFWNSVNDLDRNNADFGAICERLKIDAATLDAIFDVIPEA